MAIRKAAAKKSTAKPKPKRPARGIAVFAATKKGLWIFRSDASRKSWKPSGPHFLGNIIHHAMLDPRDGRTLLAAAKTGHLGPTIFRSTDMGKSWKEAKEPPAFPKKVDGSGRTVDHTFWLTPGHASEPNVWYAGTSPQGIFRSEDGGVTWESQAGLNENMQYREWMGSEQDGTPDGPKLHSIIIDPRDRQHMYFAMSSGGVHESHDGGANWKTLIKGMEVVEGFDKSIITYHDPHCVRMCATNPDRLYQQNHCGIYRLDRPGDTWKRVGKAMPGKVGDVGFPIVLHPRDDKTAWVFPMDGTMVWPRTSPDGKPGAWVTRDGGKSWTKQSKGLPQDKAWWTVKRQAMSVDAGNPVGVYFGTASGMLWGSRDEGKSWNRLAEHLPEIYAVEAAQI